MMVIKDIGNNIIFDTNKNKSCEEQNNSQPNVYTVLQF